MSNLLKLGLHSLLVFLLCLQASLLFIVLKNSFFFHHEVIQTHYIKFVDRENKKNILFLTELLFIFWCIDFQHFSIYFLNTDHNVVHICFKINCPWY